MKKRALPALLLCIALLISLSCAAFAAQSEARLYNVYGDHMLFQQNAEAVFAGEASPGAALTVTLADKTGTVVREARGTAGADGTFSLSFASPAGSFDPYTVTLSANGSAAAVLSDVVFGELWLSFGQSNMEYNLHGTPQGRAMQQAGKTGSRSLRVLQVPHPVKDGALQSDAFPQTDAQNCYWYTGDQTDVYTMSAVGYFFAEKLLASLNVPVGILNAAVGGSSIISWIPREAIETDAAVKDAVRAHGAYIPLSEFTGSTYHIDMTGLYNSKIAPLTVFRPAGAIWYQGETDLMTHNDPAYYERLFTLLQDSYTAAFHVTRGRLPMVFNQLVSYDYDLGPYALTAFNEAYTRLAAADPAGRSEVTVHDLPLDYYEEWGAIHPMTKQPIGERMAACALGLAYGGNMPASAPAKTNLRTENGSVYVTFSNVGEGLTCAGNALRGFAVYGADGVCLPAVGEIVSPDTVRVWNAAVSAPAGAVYAVNSVSPTANLWSSHAGKAYLPAAAFGASDPAAAKLFDDAEYLRCDTLAAWQDAESGAGIRDVWTAKGASLSVAADAAEGSGSLAVAAEKRSFSVCAPFAEYKNTKAELYNNLDTDFTAYGTLSVRVKATGAKDVALTGLRLYQGRALYYCPQCVNSGKNSVTVPADGQWHTLTFDLDRLGLYGSPADRWSNDTLTGVTELRLCFTGSGASLQIDDLRFAPENAERQNAGSLLQRLIAFFNGLFEKIRAAFRKA